jgi:hypothetical protein
MALWDNDPIVGGDNNKQNLWDNDPILQSSVPVQPNYLIPPLEQPQASFVDNPAEWLAGAFEGRGDNIALGAENVMKGADLAIADFVPEQAYSFDAKLNNVVSDLLPDGWLDKNPATSQEFIDQTIGEVQDNNQQISENIPANLTDWQKGLGSAVESAPITLASIGATLINPALGLASFTGYEGLGSYSDARADGKGKGQALAYGTVNGLIEGVTERWGLGNLFKVFDKTGASKEFLKYVGKEFVGEQMATLGQSLNGWAHDIDKELSNPDVSLADKAELQANRQKITAISTLFMTGATGGVKGTAMAVDALAPADKKLGNEMQNAVDNTEVNPQAINQNAVDMLNPNPDAITPETRQQAPEQVAGENQAVDSVFDSFDKTDINVDGDTDSFGNPLETDFAGQTVQYDQNADIRSQQMDRNAGMDDVEFGGTEGQTENPAPVNDIPHLKASKLGNMKKAEAQTEATKRSIDTSNMTKNEIVDAIDDYQQGNVVNKKLVEPKAPVIKSKTPILSWMAQRGVARDSELGQTLNSQDVKRVGLYRDGKQAGYDNIPVVEFTEAFGITPEDDGNGYVDIGWLSEQAVAESAGETTLNEQQIIEEDNYQYDLQVFNDELAKRNLDVNAIINDTQIESEEDYINTMLDNANMEGQRGNNEQATEANTGQDERSSEIRGQTNPVSTYERGLPKAVEDAGKSEEQTSEVEKQAVTVDGKEIDIDAINDPAPELAIEYATQAGKPFKTKAILEKRLNRDGLTANYDIVEKDSGFVGVRRSENDNLDEEFDDEFDGDINFSVKSGGRRFTTRMIDYLEKQANGKEFVKRGHFDNLLAGGKKQASTRDKNIVNKVMQMPEFKDAKKISIPAFIKAMESKLLQFETIESNTYSTYGANSIGLNANSENAKTVILNTDFNHGEKGHFSGDFDKTTTRDDLEIRKINAGSHEVDGQTQNVDTDKYYVTIKGLTADNLESGTFADFNTEEEAQTYIDNFANRKTEDAGMLSHYRRMNFNEETTIIKDGEKTIPHVSNRDDHWIHKFNRILGNGPTLSKDVIDDDVLELREEINRSSNIQLKEMMLAYDKGTLSIENNEDQITHVLEYQSDTMQNINKASVRKSLTRSNKELRKQEEEKIVKNSKDNYLPRESELYDDATTLSSLNNVKLGKKNYTQIRDAFADLLDSLNNGDISNVDLIPVIERLNSLEQRSGMFEGETDYIETVVNVIDYDLHQIAGARNNRETDTNHVKVLADLKDLGMRGYIDRGIGSIKKANETLDYKYKRSELDPIVVKAGVPVGVQTAGNLDELVSVLDGFVDNQKVRLGYLSKKAEKITKRLDDKYKKEGNYYRENSSKVADLLIEVHRTVEDGSRIQFGKHVTYQRDNNSDDYQKKAINSMLREMKHASSGLLPTEVELWTNENVAPYIKIIESHIEKAQAIEKSNANADITKQQELEIDKADQFAGFKQDHYKVTIQEAIKGAHRDGSKVIRFPTPQTISYIEGYVDEDGEGGFLIYGDQSIGDTVTTHLGMDAIMTNDYGEDGGYELASAESGVREFTLEEFIDDEASNWHQEFENNVDVDEFRERLFKDIVGRRDYIEQNDEKKTDLSNVKVELQALDITELMNYGYGGYGVGQTLSDKYYDEYKEVLQDNPTDQLDAVFDSSYYIYDNYGTDYVVIAQEYGEQLDVYDESYSTGMDKENFRLSDVPNENGYQDIARKYGYDPETKTKGVFYKYLEKLRPDLREITDNEGNTWYESDITPEDGSPTVLFQTKTKESLKHDSTNEQDTEFTQAHKEDIKHLRLALARAFRKPVKDVQISQGRLDMSQEERTELEILFNKRITPVKTDEALNRFNGAVIGSRPNAIFVNEDSEQQHISVIGHEMVHEMRKDNPELFNQLAESLGSVVDDKGFNSYKNQLDSDMENAGIPLLDVDGVREEFIADLMADNWNSEMFWKKVAVENMSTYKKIARWVGTWIAKLLDKAGKLARQHNMLRRNSKAVFFTNDLVKTQDIMAKVMRQYIKARKGDKTSLDVLNNGAVKFQTKSNKTKKDNKDSFIRKDNKAVIGQGDDDLDFGNKINDKTKERDTKKLEGLDQPQASKRGPSKQRLDFDGGKKVEVTKVGNAIEHIQNTDHYLKHYEKQLTGKNTLYEKLKTQNAGVKEMTEMLLESFEDQYKQNLKSNKLTMKDFDSYMKAKAIGARLKMMRDRRQDKSIKEYAGWTEAQGVRYIDGLSAEKLAGLKKVEAWYRKVIARNNKLKVEFGLDTQANINMYNKREPNYVSWKEFGNIEDAGIFYNPYSDTPSGVGRGQRKQQQALGRNSESGDVVTNLLRETGDLLKSVGQLNIERGLLNMINSYEGSAKDFSMNDVTYKEQLNPETGLVEVVYNRAIDKDDFIVFDNDRINKEGKPTRMLVKPKTEVAQRIIQQLRNERTRSLEGTAGEWIAQYMRFLSSMITMYNPEFALFTNPVRDFGTVMFQMDKYPEFQTMKDGKKKVMKNLPKAWKDIAQYQWGKDKTGDFALLRQFGGKTGWSVVSTDYQKTNKHIQARVKNISRANYNPVKGVRLLMDQVKKTNEVMENGIRLAIFRTLLDQNFPEGHHIKPSELTKEERKVIDRASFIAKNVSLDFNMKGNQSGWMKATWLFVNPAVQGAERTIESFKHKKVRHSLYIAFGVWTMNAMMQMMLMGDADDDGENDYQNIPAYQRNTGMNVLVSENEMAHVPLPLNLAMLNTLSNQVAKYTLASIDTENEFKVNVKPYDDIIEMLGSVMYSLAPVDVISTENPMEEMLPTIMQLPFVDLKDNKNFYGGQIYQEDKYSKHPTPAPYNYKKGTNEWAVEMSQFLHHLSGGDETHTGTGKLSNIHPESLEYTFDYLMGGFGSFIRRAVHLPEKMRDDEAKVNDIPFVRRIIKSRTDYSLTDRFNEAIDISIRNKSTDRAMWQKAVMFEKMIGKYWKGYGNLKKAGEDKKAQEFIETINEKQRSFLKLYNSK